MEQSENTTNVVFRKYKDGEIIALFPNDYYYSEEDKDTISSYMHIGQHSGASYTHVIKTTKPALEDEYKDLYNELLNIGYNLNVKLKR